METEIISYINYFFSIIGFYGPFLLLLSNIFLLYYYKFYKYLIIYIFGFLFNILLNIILKLIFKQPRPNEDIKLFELMLQNGNRMSFDKYGMPSGHSQSCGFSLAFFYFVTKNINISLLYFIISIITLSQRVIYNNHTLIQVIIGFFIGILFGFFVYIYGKKLLQGFINYKKDDFSFIFYNWS